MWPFNSPAYNSFFTYLNAGNPSVLTQFAIANAVLCLMFLYFRARKSKVDYQRIRPQLQLLTVLANVAVLFGDSLMATMHNALLPFRGLFDVL
jgi:drug/metabolite transporter (DMT)-like permease